MKNSKFFCKWGKHWLISFKKNETSEKGIRISLGPNWHGLS